MQDRIEWRIFIEKVTPSSSCNPNINHLDMYSCLFL